jgi:hypothetical protein
MSTNELTPKRRGPTVFDAATGTFVLRDSVGQAPCALAQAREREPRSEMGHFDLSNSLRTIFLRFGYLPES